MKVEKIKLTPGYVNDLKSRSETYYKADTLCPGLLVKVRPFFKDKNGNEHQGRKSFVWRYRPKGKSPTEMTLGRVEYLSPDKARRKVKSLQGKHASATNKYTRRNHILGREYMKEKEVKTLSNEEKTNQRIGTTC